MGSERALRRRDPDGATFLFGQGPPRVTTELEGRRRDLRRALESAVDGLCWCNQVHGVEVRAVRRPGAEERLEACDGLLTATPAIALLLQTADCVPVLAAGRRVVAAVHAGWRGAAGGIVRRLIERCRRLYEEEPTALRVYLGPAICGEHYPVGDEVIAALETQRVDATLWRRGEHVDLRAFLAAQLHALGVDRVQSVGPCTAGTPTLASYRRDGAKAGRQLSVVYRRRP